MARSCGWGDRKCRGGAAPAQATPAGPACPNRPHLYPRRARRRRAGAIGLRRAAADCATRRGERSILSLTDDRWGEGARERDREIGNDQCCNRPAPAPPPPAAVRLVATWACGKQEQRGHRVGDAGKWARGRARGRGGKGRGGALLFVLAGALRQSGLLGEGGTHLGAP